MNQDISRSEPELNNPMLGGLEQAVRDVIPKIQAALAKKYWPMDAPVGRTKGNTDPPREPKAGELGALPRPPRV